MQKRIRVATVLVRLSLHGLQSAKNKHVEENINTKSENLSITIMYDEVRDKQAINIMIRRDGTHLKFQVFPVPSL